MKFPVLRFIHYCLWIVGVAGAILIFLSPFLVYLFALRDLPTGSSTTADLIRISPNLLASGLAAIAFALPIIALAELIALGLAIESHLSVSRRTNEQTVLLLERIANRNSRPASAAAPAKPAAAPARPTPAPAAPAKPTPAPAARPAASPARPAPAPSVPPPATAVPVVSAAPQPEPPVPPAQPEQPVPAPQAEASAPEPPAEAPASPEPEDTLSAEVTAQNAFVFERPDVRSRFLGSAKPGRALKLYGRDESGQWLSADATGTKWIQASHVHTESDLSSLPVINPPA